MKKTMICLIGEQPVANLLPVLYCKPKTTLLIHSDRTQSVSKNLECVLTRKGFAVSGQRIDETYEITKAQSEMETLVSQPNSDTELVFNVTGGTKPMSFAALRMAQKLKAPIVYLQSEGAKSLLYSYRFEGQDLMLEKDKEELGELITIDDYLRVHGLKDWKQKKEIEAFEKAVYDALNGNVSEIIPNVCKGSLEIDLVIRCKNQVGVAEVKAGRKAEKKEGIDQLSTASQREYLGTYTNRFLIVDRQLPSNNADLAQAHRIRVITIQDDWKSGISEHDKQQLVKAVTKDLGIKS